MYERLQGLSLQIYVIGLSTLALYIYLKLVKIWLKKQPYDNIDWLKDNRGKLALSLGIPYQNIYAPMSEELLYRLPIIVMFSNVSPNAWIGIIISALLFGAIHSLNPNAMYVGPEVLNAGIAKGRGAKFSDVSKEIVEKEKRILSLLRPIRSSSHFCWACLADTVVLNINHSM